MINWLSSPHTPSSLCRSISPSISTAVKNPALSRGFWTAVSNQKQTFILIIVHSKPQEHDRFCLFIMSPPLRRKRTQGCASYQTKPFPVAFSGLIWKQNKSGFSWKQRWRGIRDDLPSGRVLLKTLSCSNVLRCITALLSYYMFTTLEWMDRGVGAAPDTFTPQKAREPAPQSEERPDTSLSWLYKWQTQSHSHWSV